MTLNYTFTQLTTYQAEFRKQQTVTVLSVKVRIVCSKQSIARIAQQIQKISFVVKVIHVK